ncbi:hypothetical protein Tco_0411218 [Tanacetum coccineum]
MANEHVPSPATTRSDDQILLFNAWVPIGKGNHVLDLQKKQRNPIFRSPWILCITQTSSELSPHQLMFLTALQSKESSGILNASLVEVGFNPLVHSFRALSTLRRSGLRTASAVAKPCQGDSSEVYVITGRILMVAAAGHKRINAQPHAHASYS